MRSCLPSLSSNPIMLRRERRDADKAAELVTATVVRWRGDRAGYQRHSRQTCLVAKPQPELISRRGMPPSTSERANSITVLQAQSAWARLFEPVLGVQCSGVGEWQAHNYSNLQQQHIETFSFQWDWRVNPVILSGRQFGWIMKGCVLSACLTEGQWAKGAMLQNSLAFQLG